MNSCKIILEREYLKRKERNATFSLRSFARYLGIGIASLSDAISGKRSLSQKNLQKIIARLNLGPAEVAQLEQDAKECTHKKTVDFQRLLLEEDQFRVISDWYHYAILELAQVPEHRATPEWLGDYFGISVIEARVALDRLIGLGLVKIVKNRLVRLTPPVTTTGEIPSSAIRKRHRQILEKSIDSLEMDPVEKRKFFSITLAIDPAKIDTAREMMIKYARRVAKMLSEKNQKEIYSLNWSLIPLVKR